MSDMERALAYDDAYQKGYAAGYRAGMAHVQRVVADLDIDEEIQMAKDAADEQDRQPRERKP